MTSVESTQTPIPVEDPTRGQVGEPGSSTNPASGVDWVRVVRDNRGSHFLVDFRLGTRHPLSGPGTGQYQAATSLYGDPITRRSQLPDGWQRAQESTFPGRSDILLDGRVGYQEGEAAIDLFGGPNSMERVVAGNQRDPFTGGFVESPREITTGSGETITPDNPVSPDPASPDPASPDDDQVPIEQVNARARIRDTLRRYDLPDSLGDWAWDQMRDGRSAAWIETELVNRPEFKERFPAIHEMRDQGLTPPSADEYVAYEQQVEQLSAQLNLPSDMHSRDRIKTMLVNRVDPNQVSQFADLYGRLRGLGLA